MAKEPERSGYVVKGTVPLSEQADIYADERGAQEMEAPDADEMPRKKK